MMTITFYVFLSKYFSIGKIKQFHLYFILVKYEGTKGIQTSIYTQIFDFIIKCKKVQNFNTHLKFDSISYL